MNICIVSTYDCTFEEFEAVVTESQDEVSAFVSEWELIKVNDHKSVMFVNCTDMDAMAASCRHRRCRNGIAPTTASTPSMRSKR